MAQEISFPGHSDGYPASILDVVRLGENTDTVVAQCLGHDQHCLLVQPYAYQIPAAAVDLAAIGLVGPGRSTVVGNLFKRASIYLIQEICIIPAEAVDVRHGVNVGPNLSVGSETLKTGDNIRNAGTNHGSVTHTAALAAADIHIVILLEESGIVQSPQHCPLGLGGVTNSTETGTFGFDALSAPKIIPTKQAQFLPPESGPATKINQILIVGHRKMPVRGLVATASGDVRPVPVGQNVIIPVSGMWIPYSLLRALR